MLCWGSSRGSQQKALLQELQGKSRPCGGGGQPGEEDIDPAPVQPLAALTHCVQDEDMSVLQYISCNHLRAAESSSTPYLSTIYPGAHWMTPHG